MRPIGDRSNSRPCRRAASSRPTTGVRVDQGQDGHLFDQRQERRRAARSDGPARPEARLPDPRHRADAYTVSWDIDWKEKDGSCRVANAAARCRSPTPIPQVTRDDVARPCKRRWTRFMAGVHKHEETHGRIARQMVDAAEKSVSAISYKNDPPLPQDAGRAQEAHRLTLRQIRGAAGRVRPRSSTARAAMSRGWSRCSARASE